MTTIADEVPHDDPLRWRVSEMFRWLRWCQGLAHWTPEEREAAREFLRLAEVASLRDPDGVAEMTADASNRGVLVASAGVWVLMAEIRRSADPLGLGRAMLTPAEPRSTVTELEYERAVADVVGLAVELLDTMAMPAEDVGTHSGLYSRVRDLARPYPLHAMAAASLVAGLYQSRPAGLAELRKSFGATS